MLLLVLTGKGPHVCQGKKLNRAGYFWLCRRNYDCCSRRKAMGQKFFKCPGYDFSPDSNKVAAGVRLDRLEFPLQLTGRPGMRLIYMCLGTNLYANQ